MSFLVATVYQCFDCDLVMSSETGCSVTERIEKERYFSGAKNFVIYLVIFLQVFSEAI